MYTTDQELIPDDIENWYKEKEKDKQPNRKIYPQKRENSIHKAKGKMKLNAPFATNQRNVEIPLPSNQQKFLTVTSTGKDMKQRELSLAAGEVNLEE